MKPIRKPSVIVASNDLDSSKIKPLIRDLEEIELNRILSKYENKKKVTEKLLDCLKKDLFDAFGKSRGNSEFDFFVKKHNYDVDLSNPKTNFHKSNTVKKTIQGWKDLQRKINYQREKEEIPTGIEQFLHYQRK